MVLDNGKAADANFILSGLFLTSGGQQRRKIISPLALIAFHIYLESPPARRLNASAQAGYELKHEISLVFYICLNMSDLSGD